jgi:hypothetical protein
MSFIDELKQKAEAEIAALKADARSVEERIEAAFHLGAVHAALDAIVKDARSVEEKVAAAFELGKASK